MQVSSGEGDALDDAGPRSFGLGITLPRIKINGTPLETGTTRVCNRIIHENDGMIEHAIEQERPIECESVVGERRAPILPGIDDSKRFESA